MILNISRLKAFYTCRRYTFNKYHRNLDGRRSMNLVDGTAFHKGAAHGQATKNWTDAIEVAKAQFDEDVKSAGFSADEDFLVSVHWRVVKKTIELYAENWRDTGMEVLQPECTFEYDIPGTEHNDITMHWLDKRTGEEFWGMPTPEAILTRAVASPHNQGYFTGYNPISDPACACYRPHRIVGRTDGILSWKGAIWLQEHKTTAIKDERFWKQWHLDPQLTGYVYGVWKATGLKPYGVVLNALYKPSESQIAAWNSKRKDPATAKDVTQYMEYMRDAFLRSDKDLARFEQDFIDACDDWEYAILKGRFPIQPVGGHCFNYNRECDFYQLCLNHDDEQYLDIVTQRTSDYVDDFRHKDLVQIVKSSNATLSGS